MARPAFRAWTSWNSAATISGRHHPSPLVAKLTFVCHAQQCRAWSWKWQGELWPLSSWLEAHPPPWPDLNLTLPIYPQCPCFDTDGMQRQRGLLLGKRSSNSWRAKATATPHTCLVLVPSLVTIVMVVIRKTRSFLGNSSSVWELRRWELPHTKDSHASSLSFLCRLWVSW